MENQYLQNEFNDFFKKHSAELELAISDLGKSMLVAAKAFKKATESINDRKIKQYKLPRFIRIKTIPPAQ